MGLTCIKNPTDVYLLLKGDEHLYFKLSLQDLGIKVYKDPAKEFLISFSEIKEFMQEFPEYESVTIDKPEDNELLHNLLLDYYTKKISCKIEA